MNLYANQSSTDVSITSTSSALARRIAFIILAILVVPPIASSCTVLYLVGRDRRRCTRMKNHLIICIFVLNFFQTIYSLPFIFAFLYLGRVLIPSDTFCQYWFSINIAFWVMSLQVNALFSTERYLFIFHSRILHRYRILLHYLPMILLLTYPMPYSFALTIFSECENHFDYSLIACGSPCYVNKPVLGIAHWICAILIPVLIIISSHLFTCVKLHYQKSELLRQNTWRKKTRMLRQLFSITALLSISWVPFSLLSAIEVVSLTPGYLKYCVKWALFACIYLSVLFSPIVSVLALPNLKTQILRWVGHRRGTANNQIRPITSVAT